MRVGSLFSGVGGFDLGLECAGMDVVWQVENDRFCRQVLRARWPDVDLYGNVKDVGADQLAAVDLICGGFPCQDLSVAGRRAGLAGERSGLFFEFVRIAREVAPRWLLVENVPGLLSSHDGRDFAVLLRELTGFWPVVPDAGWQEAGVCEGPQGRAVWRVLDTQHFGPPQRRRRVFVVVDTTGRCGPEILLEPSCVPGHPTARREAGEGAAGESAGGVGIACGGRSGVATTLDKHYHKGPGSRGNKERQMVAGAVKKQGGPDENDAKDGRIIAPTVRVGGREQGAGNSYDNTPWTAFNWQSGGDVRQNPTEGRTDAIHKSQTPAVFNLRGRDGGAMPEPDDKASVRSAQGGSSRSYVYPTLRENWRNNSNPATEARMLAWSGGKHTTGYQGDRAVHPSDKACTIPSEGANNGGGGGGQILGQAVPRRLTPVEVERLQGFPDDWTATGIDADGEPTEISDTQRYRQMGNAVSVPVAAWVGSRIVATEMGAIAEVDE